MPKFLEYLDEAQRTIKACDHMIYVSYPLIKDKKLIIKVLNELKKGVAYCINSILQHEYIFKRIKLYQEPKTNFETFKNKSAKRFGITPEETKKILELFEIIDMHQKSPMTFAKDEKVVILTNNMQKKIVSLDLVKEFLYLSKNILKKTSIKIKE